MIVPIMKVYEDSECFRGQTANSLSTAPARDLTTGKQDWSDVHPSAAPTSGGMTRKQDRNQVHPSEVKADYMLSRTTVVEWAPDPKSVFRNAVLEKAHRWSSVAEGFGVMRWCSFAEKLRGMSFNDQTSAGQRQDHRHE